MTLARAGFIPIPPGAQRGFDHADVYHYGWRLHVARTGADRMPQSGGAAVYTERA